MKDFDEIGGASGLEIAACCPRCGPRAMLVDRPGELRENECPRCSGCLLMPESALVLVDTVLQISPAMFQQLVERSRPSSLRCQVCHGSSALVSVRGTNVSRCTRCEAMWIDAGGLHTLTGGRYGKAAARSAASPAAAAVDGGELQLDVPARPHSVPSSPFASKRGDPRPAAPTRRAAAPRPASRAPIYLGVTVLVLGAIGGVFGARYWVSPPAVVVSPPPAVPLSIGTVAPPPPAAASDFVFAGRDLDWWAKRLTALRAREGEEARRLYALTVRRARQNGMTVEEKPDRVEVGLSKELIAKMGARGAVR